MNDANGGRDSGIQTHENQAKDDKMKRIKRTSKSSRTLSDMTGASLGFPVAAGLWNRKCEDEEETRGDGKP